MNTIDYVYGLLKTNDFLERSALLRGVREELKVIFEDVAPRKYFFVRCYPEIFLSKGNVCLEFKNRGSSDYKNIVSQFQADLGRFFIMNVEVDREKTLLIVEEEKPWVKKRN